MPLFRSLAVLILGGSVAMAADWPQWLGPHRDASSPEPVAVWKEAPRVLWRQPAGEGNSSPVVAGGRVFLHTKVKDRNEEEVAAFGARDGRPLWRRSYPRAAFQSLYGSGPRATPAVADGRVYTFGITGVLSCFQADTGKLLWQVDTLKTFAGKNLFFGMACSPLVEGRYVLVNVGAPGASVVAFDKETGKTAWKSQDDRASYASPIVFGRGRSRQVVFLTQQGVIALDPADGRLFWRFPLVDRLLESSTTPVRADDVLLASSITYGSVGLHLETRDSKPTARQLWKNDSLTCYFATPVAVGREYVYLVTGTRPPALFNQATLHCIETQTGKELWQRPNVGTYHASLLRTGNARLLMLEEAGNLVLLDPDPKAYRELARARICGHTWAHPALADGKLYIRDGKELIGLRLTEPDQSGSR